MVDDGSVAALRRPVLSQRTAGGAAVALDMAPEATRLALRAPGDSVAALSRALGLDLPTRPKRSTSAGGRHALWLGPDEWLVIDEDEADLAVLLRDVSDLHSAVDVSHRNVAIRVTGAGAAGVINAGCPQDLSLDAFPVGACSRTILHKAEIVLLRTAPDAFRVECWRSFADYAFAYLEQAARAGT